MSAPTSAPVRIGVLSVVVIAIGLLVGVAASVTLDGSAHEGWRICGRLHPLVVHFPIALLLVAPLMDLVSRWRPVWREPAGMVVWMGAIGAYVAAFAGLSLAYADGHSGTGLSLHLWGGVAVAGCAMLASVVRAFRWWRIYSMLSLSTAGMLGWAAHQGGNLTHGEYYLTEGLPLAVQRALGLPEGLHGSVEDPNTVFGAAVSGVLEAHCVSCHGAQKQKGNYRVDIFEAMLAGGQSGLSAILPGDVGKSELVRRMHLPVSDKKAMPPRGRPRPRDAELQLLRWWISHGASRDLKLSDARRRDPAVMELLGTVMQESGRDLYVPRVPEYGHLAGQIAALSETLNVSLVAVSERAGDGLILRCRNRESSFSNKTLAGLASVAPFIVEAELGGTQIDDAGIAGFAAFHNLVRLNIEKTKVSGATLSQLAQLPELMMINLCDSQLTDEGLKQAAAIPSLRKIHTLGSAVTNQGLTEFLAVRPDCETP